MRGELHVFTAAVCAHASSRGAHAPETRRQHTLGEPMEPFSKGAKPFSMDWDGGATRMDWRLGRVSQRGARGRREARDWAGRHVMAADPWSACMHWRV